MPRKKTSWKDRENLFPILLIFWVIIITAVMLFAGGCEPGNDSFDDESYCADLELIEGDWYDPDGQLMTVTLTDFASICKADFQGPGAYLTGTFNGIELPLIRAVGSQIQQVDSVFGLILTQSTHS